MGPKETSEIAEAVFLQADAQPTASKYGRQRSRKSKHKAPSVNISLQITITLRNVSLM